MKFTGTIVFSLVEYELNKGEKYILSKVYKGKIKNEKTFSNNILLMEKIYEGCYFGIQKNYDSPRKTN